MPLLFALWMFAAQPKWSPWLAPHRAPGAVVWVASAAASHGASMAEAKLALVWLILESGADRFAVNVESGACGPLQELGVGRRGHSCEELSSDPILAVKVWFEDLDIAREWCRKKHWRKGEAHLRSTRAALAVLADGTCTGEKGGKMIVDQRCGWSSGSCEDE